jgi:hypothetical protein
MCSTGGEPIAAVAKELGLGDQTLRNWIKAVAQDKLQGAGSKAVTPEAMELSRMRAERRPRLVGHKFDFVKWGFADVGLSTVPLAAPCAGQGRAARWITRPTIYAVS